MTDPFSEAPWTTQTGVDLGAARDVPTMLSPLERQMYLWLARDYATGAGCIVDLGCFAGGSAALLAEGQVQAGRAGTVHAYDAFKVSDWLKEKYLYPLGIIPFDGDDLGPLARQVLAPWPCVQMHAGRIEAQDWTGGPIEILAMDASKTATTMDRMAEIFFPALIPGRSVVIQQDFLHWKQPWIAVQMYLLRECFEPVAFCPRHNLLFRCSRVPTGPEIAAAACAGLTDGQMIDLLRAARDQVQGFGIGRQMRVLIQAVKGNPGIRAAWDMKSKP